MISVFTHGLIKLEKMKRQGLGSKKIINQYASLLCKKAKSLDEINEVLAVLHEKSSLSVDYKRGAINFGDPIGEIVDCAENDNGITFKIKPNENWPL